jgi:hypothetical protein
MKATLLKRAYEMAHDEASGGRNTMVLVPDDSWIGVVSKTFSCPIASHGAIHVRCSTYHSGLKSVAIDTLILVGSTDSAWDVEGMNYAHERLKTSTKPKVIILGEEA